MRIYLGPFVWRERIGSKTGLPAPAGVFGWRMPVGAVQAIDFRGPQGSEMTGSLSPAQAIFVTPDDVILPAPWVQLASDPAETLTAANRLQLRTAFRHGKAVAARRFVDVLHELMTTHAEINRARCCPPRIASKDGQIKWMIGGQIAHAVTPGPGSPEWAGVVARHREAYRAIRQLAGGARLHSKYLATLLDKYRLSEGQGADAFIPGDLPREEPVAPTTTYAESFPGTSATLGGDQTWTEDLASAWSNNGGVGQYIKQDANTRFARCESALSTDDMRVQLSLVQEFGPAYWGPVGRLAASGFTCYSNLSRPALNDYYGQRVTSGSSTDIITSELSGSITLPSTSAIEIDGDQIEIFEGANSRGLTTDTNITGNVRGGVAAWAEAGWVTFDSWQAEDLSAPPSSVATLSWILA